MYGLLLDASSPVFYFPQLIIWKRQDWDTRHRSEICDDLRFQPWGRASSPKDCDTCHRPAAAILKKIRDDRYFIRIKVDFASLQDLFCVCLASFGIVQRCDSMRQHSEPGSMPAAFAEVPSSTWLDPIRIDIINMCISTEHTRLGRTDCEGRYVMNLKIC